MIDRSNEQIELMVQIQAVAGKQELLKPVLTAMLAPSRGEAGCLFYNLFESHLPGRFFFHEMWTSQAALDEHERTPHYLRFVQETKPLFAYPAIVHRVSPVNPASR